MNGWEEISAALGCPDDESPLDGARRVARERGAALAEVVRLKVSNDALRAKAEKWYDAAHAPDRETRRWELFKIIFTEEFHRRGIPVEAARFAVDLVDKTLAGFEREPATETIDCNSRTITEQPTPPAEPKPAEPEWLTELVVAGDNTAKYLYDDHPNRIIWNNAKKAAREACK
jgi:hypothetical protein